MDFAASVAASREASEAQHNAERFYAAKGRECAEAEKAYREGLAKAITELKAAGATVTAARDLARGDKHVADLAYERDLAEGLRDAAAQSIWRHTADRRELEQFISWSKRAAFLDMEPPRESSVIGARRAAA
jgi:putative intracellular protease/amidase